MCDVEEDQHITVARGVEYQREYHDVLAKKLLNDAAATPNPWSVGLWSNLDGVWTSQLMVSWVS